MSRIWGRIKQLAVTAKDVTLFTGTQFSIILVTYPILSIFDHALELKSIKETIVPLHSIKNERRSRTQRLLATIPKFGVDSVLTGLKITVITLADLNKNWITKGSLEVELKSQLTFRLNSVGGISAGLGHAFDIMYGPWHITTIVTDQSFADTRAQLSSERMYAKGFFMKALELIVEYGIQQIIPVPTTSSYWKKIVISLLPKLVAFPLQVSRRSSQVTIYQPVHLKSTQSSANRVRKEIAHEIESLKEILRLLQTNSTYRWKFVKGMVYYLGSCLSATWLMLYLERRLAHFLMQDPNRTQMVGVFLSQACYIFLSQETLTKTAVKIGIKSLKSSKQ